jgi:hypothetical protein
LLHVEVALPNCIKTAGLFISSNQCCDRKTPTKLAEFNEIHYGLGRLKTIKLQTIETVISYEHTG